MELLESSRTDPFWNLALEEYLFENPGKDRRCLFLWQNDRTIVVGKNQNTAAEINGDYVKERGIHVVRRLSGGGAVYHDLGNLNFTFMEDAGDERKIDFGRFCRPVTEALRSFGVEAELSGRNDMTVGGKKFSGNAQYFRNGRVLHHGTILFASDLTVLEQALKVDREKIVSKGIASVTGRVTNLKELLPPGVTLDDLKQRLLACLECSEPITRRELSGEETAAVEALRKERYSSWEWNYGRSPACSIKKSARYEGCGRVEVSMQVEAGIIRDISFSGDFFGSADLRELSAALCGCPARKDVLTEKLKNYGLEKYIYNCRPERLAELLAL